MPFAYKKGGNQAAKQRKGRQKKKRKGTTKNYASVASMSAAGKSDIGAVTSKLRTSRFFIGGIAFISVPSTAACSTRRKSPWLTKSTRCASG